MGRLDSSVQGGASVNEHDDEETVEAPTLPNAQLAQEYAVIWGVREIFEPTTTEETDAQDHEGR